MRDHYVVLGVPRHASQEEILTVYRRLAREYHPDRNPGSALADERFREVQLAYEILGDVSLRAQYDRQPRWGWWATLTTRGVRSRGRRRTVRDSCSSAWCSTPWARTTGCWVSPISTVPRSSSPACSGTVTTAT